MRRHELATVPAAVVPLESLLPLLELPRTFARRSSGVPMSQNAASETNPRIDPRRAAISAS